MAINFTALNNACKVYYSMDNANVSGSTILDLTANNYDITNNGGTTGAVGILNEAVNLGTRAETKYLKLDGQTFDFVRTTGDFYISLWWKPNNYLENNYNVLFSSGTAGSSSHRGWSLMYEQRSSQGSPQRLQFDIATGASIQRYSTPNNVITSNDWYHILITGDGTTVKIFIDGTEVTSQSFGGVVTGTSTYPDFYVGAISTVLSSGQGEFDEISIGGDWSTVGTAQELATYFHNSGSLTVNQQYPMSSNVETLELNTLNLTSSLQDVNIKNIINEQLDVLQINSNLQDITFKNTIKEELQPITFSLGLQDIQFTTADILNLTPLQFNSSLQDITFKNTIKEDLDTLTFNTNLQDVEIKNTIQFTLDPLQFNLNLLNVSLPEPQIETLELEPLVFNLGLNDIRFQLVTSPLLDSARNDIQQVLEEIGEPITYRRINKEFDDVGQLKEVTTTDYQTLALFEDGDDKNKETNQYGEFIAGTQNVNIAYQVSEGVYPKAKDIIIDVNSVEWEIVKVRPQRLYQGGVWDNNIVVQRKTNYQ